MTRALLDVNVWLALVDPDPEPDQGRGRQQRGSQGADVKQHQRGVTSGPSSSTPTRRRTSGFMRGLSSG